MTNKEYDAIVIGAGSSGLVAAAYLAKAGQRVLVLEQRGVVGGLGAVEEFAPGFRAPAAPVAGWIPDRVIRDLNLSKHGLKVTRPNPTVFTPLPDGDHLLLWQEIGKTAEGLKRFSKRDAERWPEFCRFVRKATQILEKAYLLTPPDGLNVTPGEIPAVAGLGLDVRRMGDRDMMEFIRVLPMSAQEFFEYWFESEAIRGTLAASAVMGIRQGPRSAGTTFVFLHHHVGAAEGVFRAAGQVAGGIGKVLSDAATAHGATIRSGARVAHIFVEDGAAVGVALVDGTEVRARRVISSLDPSHTFLRLVDPLELPPSFIRAVQNIKYRGAAAVVNLALAELPEFTALPGDGPHLRGAISISPSLEYLERAYDAAKYGEISQRPMLEIHIPSLSDPSAAPGGQHTMTIAAQFAPYHLRDGAAWDDAACQTLLNNVLDTLSEYAPNVKNAILHTQVITPKDLEDVYGLTHGSLYHGELTLDQVFFMRPVPGYAQYRSPIEGLYLCGAGTHPGGGVTGAPAYNAAREILSAARRGK